MKWLVGGLVWILLFRNALNKGVAVCAGSIWSTVDAKQKREQKSERQFWEKESNKTTPQCLSGLMLPNKNGKLCTVCRVTVGRGGAWVYALISARTH